MSVYFWWVVNYCPHCGRGSRYRIGEMRDNVFISDKYECGLYGTAPVRSWVDWKKIVVRAPEDRNDPLYRVPWGHIERQDGEVIPPDEFEAMIEGLAEVK